MARCMVSSFWPKTRLIRFLCFGAAVYLFLTLKGKGLEYFGFKRVYLLKDPLANSNITHHIAFVKTHKAASSTVLNILYRFARDRDLVVLLPKNGNYLYGRFLNKTSLLPPPEGKTYDILCNHAIFNHTSFSTFLPLDTVYMGIVREPFERFLSAFYYFRFQQWTFYLRRIPGKYHTLLRTYFKNLSRWEPKNPMASMTNNRMAIDFGFPAEHFHNETLFDEYLKKMNKTFRIVIVAELFDESLVLVRRAFNWTIKDILYTDKNKARFKPKRPLISEEMKRSFQNLSRLDYKLYVFFLQRLYSQMELQGELFQEEVEYFKKIRRSVVSFCGHPGRRTMQISASKWTTGFLLTRLDCTLINMEEHRFVPYMRRQQKLALLKNGANTDFMKNLPGI